MQSIPPTTANKQTQAQKQRGSRARKLLGANAKSYRLKLKLKLRRLDSKAPTRLAPAGNPCLPPLPWLQQMTYVKQLEQYEDAVMKKRVEEMTEAELQQLMTDVDTKRVATKK